MPIRAFDDTRLTRTDLKVLVAYCSCVDWKTGWGWPKARNLAAQLGMTAPTFAKYTARLKAAGYLFRGRRYEHGGFWWWVDYAGRSCPPEGNSKLPPQEGQLLYSTSFGSCTTPAPVGPEEEPMPIQDPSVWEDGGYRAPEVPAPPKRERPAPPKSPPKLNATTVAIRLQESASYYQYGYPAPPLDPIRGTFARWHREGVSYKVINEAVNLCGQELGGMLDVPLAAYFLKHGFEWIDKAKQVIYERELPKKIERYRARRAEMFAEMEKTDPGLVKYRASRFPAGPVREKAEARGF
jgi:hypothetical protein